MSLADEVLAALKASSREDLHPALAALHERHGAALELALARLQQPEGGEDPSSAAVVCLAGVVPQRTDWLWLDYVPLGMVTLLAGDPKAGKNLVTVDLAARLSRGTAMPGLQLPYEPACSIFYAGAEDDMARTLLPRLIAAGAELSRVYACPGVPTIPGDIPAMHAAIERTGARLVVIDPVSAYLSDRVDSHRDSSLRHALAPLKLVAEETGAAIVLVAHLNKSVGGPAMYRTGGSIALPGLARSVLLAGRHPESQGTRVLASLAGNLCETPPSLAYTIAATEPYDAPRIEWAGVAPGVSAESLLQQPDTQEDRTEREEAADWLRQELVAGERASADVQAAARRAGISQATLARARRELGVISRRAGYEPGAGWLMSLPIAEKQGNSADCHNMSAAPKNITGAPRVSPPGCEILGRVGEILGTSEQLPAPQIGADMSGFSAAKTGHQPCPEVLI